jgi:hypothetical protein
MRRSGHRRTREESRDRPRGGQTASPLMPALNQISSTQTISDCGGYEFPDQDRERVSAAISERKWAASVGGEKRRSRCRLANRARYSCSAIGCRRTQVVASVPGPAFAMRHVPPPGTLIR